jgi:hypothetical protein
VEEHEHEAKHGDGEHRKFCAAVAAECRRTVAESDAAEADERGSWTTYLVRDSNGSTILRAFK